MRKKLASKFIKNNKGMTLVEIILALAIFGVVSVVLLLIFTTTLSIAIQMGNREEALADASGFLDDYRTNTLYDDLAETPPDEIGRNILSSEIITIHFVDAAGALIIVGSTPNTDTYTRDVEFYEAEGEAFSPTGQRQTVTLRGFRLR